MRGMFNLVSSSTGYLEFPDRTVCRGQDLRNKLCLVRVMALQISIFKKFGLNLQTKEKAVMLVSCTNIHLASYGKLMLDSE